MSEQPKWMPDGERICMAFDLADQYGEEHGNDLAYFWLGPIRALIREAAEKALAEQEARHKREVIKAEVSRYESVLRGLRSEEQTPQVRAIIESVDADAEKYRARLAALDKEVSHE